MLLLCSSEEQKVDYIVVTCWNVTVGLMVWWIGISSWLGGWSSVVSDVMVLVLGGIVCVSLTQLCGGGVADRKNRWKMPISPSGKVSIHGQLFGKLKSWLHCTRSITFCQHGQLTWDRKSHNNISNIDNIATSMIAGKNKDRKEQSKDNMVSSDGDIASGGKLLSLCGYVVMYVQKWQGVGYFPIFGHTGYVPMCILTTHTFFQQHFYQLTRHQLIIEGN